MSKLAPKTFWVLKKNGNKRKSETKNRRFFLVPNHSAITGGCHESTGNDIGVISSSCFQFLRTMVTYGKLVLAFLRTMVMNPKNRPHNYQGSGPVYDNRPTQQSTSNIRVELLTPQKVHPFT